MLAVKKMGWH